jgi:hypothetical protein
MELVKKIRQMCLEPEVQEFLQDKEIVLDWWWGSSLLGAAWTQKERPDYILVVRSSGLRVRREGKLTQDEKANFNDSILRWDELLDIYNEENPSFELYCERIQDRNTHY